MRGPWSLRTRLALAALGLTTAFVGILTVVLNVVLTAQLARQADDILRVRAEATASTVVISPDQRVSIRDTRDDATLDVGTWIFEGTTAVESPPATASLQQQARTLAGIGERFDQTQQADPIRFYALPVRADQAQVATVVTSLHLDPYRRIEKLTWLGSSALAALVLGGAYLGFRVVVTRALQPVESMAAQAARWSALDVDRRFGNTPRPRELDVLATTLDGVLDRISAVLRREKQLSAELSHELRTPLARIIAETSLLRSRPRDRNELEAAHTIIEDSAVQMNHIVETLMATARSDSGVAPGRCEPAAVIRRAAGQLVEAHVSTGRAPVRLSLPTDSPDFSVGCDAAVLERILVPLIDNALRYARQQVTVRLTALSRRAVIDIEDDGPGIPEAGRAHLFEPGRRAQPDDGHTGAGLGLALAQRLAASAGGFITAADTGAGARFTITLPCA